MKAVMQKIKTLWKDESAQGATEYILLLAIVVGVAVFFGPQIKEAVSQKVGQIRAAISGFTPERGG